MLHKLLFSTRVFTYSTSEDTGHTNTGSRLSISLASKEFPHVCITIIVAVAAIAYKENVSSDHLPKQKQHNRNNTLKYGLKFSQVLRWIGRYAACDNKGVCASLFVQH
ncbi:hypothetical protein BDA99DRAFT_536366 [Phascolomyces articulosus]|uniref:Uncharacterized protein n=1 Tax=Phascolomyces articulosus TaxID=60185 RepID=A0AAD5KB92_9FUNG|nr:hypothetical protein BDA99DRAFT_536366 [Phascolomyces articulosus]